jgi:hypothetical protein
MNIRHSLMIGAMLAAPLLTFAQELPLLARQRCNPDPDLTPTIVASTYGGSLASFVDRVSMDPALLVALGNPLIDLTQVDRDVIGFQFPPLDDRDQAIAQMYRAFPWSTHGISLEFNARACEAAPPPDVVTALVEYFNEGLDHYFYTGDHEEMAAIDAGRVGPGWTRTGKSFDAVRQPGCPFAAGQSVVYRFYGIPGSGPNSHFFTRDRVECSLVHKSSKWSFEGVAFWASEPFMNGTCEPLPSLGRPRVPLFRAWRPFGDSNHRFSTDRTVIDEMVAKGWVDEGAAMCVLAPG